MLNDIKCKTTIKIIFVRKWKVSRRWYFPSDAFLSSLQCRQRVNTVHFGHQSHTTVSYLYSIHIH